FLVIFAVVRPIRSITEAMTAVAGGNLEVAIPAVGQRDEVGHLAGALEKFKQAAHERLKLEREQEEMKRRAEEQKRADMEKLASEFEAGVNVIVKTVSAAATQLQSSSQSMSSTAEETTRQASAVAAAAEETTANVQTVASASEELASSVA